MSLYARKRIPYLAGALALVLSPTLAANAQEGVGRMASKPPALGEAQVAVRAPDFGLIDCDVVTITAYDFEPFRKTGDVTGVNDDGNGFSWATGGANKGFVASVQVPAGVLIEYLGLRYCDTVGTSGFTATVFDNTDAGASIPVISIVAPDNSCTTVYNPTEVAYSWDLNEQHSLDIYVYQTGPDVGGQVKFRGAEVWYTRKVSPAPGTPTFTDVPTNDPAFQFIEAFYKSGITVGCQLPGNPLIYCPDANVTRREMAVFFAKALGLHFPG